MIAADVQVMKGWTIPFFPMRPANGPRLTRKLVKEILERQEEGRYVYQPKLNGDRAILAVVNRKVIIANRYYDWYQYQVANANNFLKMGNGSLFDGEVYESNFYPFECLAMDGRSLKPNTTEERVNIAEQMCRLCGVTWMYPRPTKKWLLQLDRHAPRYEGVVRKRSDFPYILLANASGISAGWLKHKW